MSGAQGKLCNVKNVVLCQKSEIGVLLVVKVVSVTLVPLHKFANPLYAMPLNYRGNKWIL